MKCVLTDAAQADLNEIIDYTLENFPGSAASLERRIRFVISRIEAWPENARLVPEREGVRVVPVIRYPFRIFYRVLSDRIEILHIHHTAREFWMTDR